MEPFGNDEPYRVLADNFNPLMGHDPITVTVAALEAAIESDMKKLLEFCGFECMNFVIRNPRKDSGFTNAAVKPHKDRYTTNIFALWANENPTIVIVDKTKEIFYPKPYQVVLVNDDLCEHHKPANVRGRWVARVAVRVKKGV